MKPRKEDVLKDENGSKIGVIIRYKVIKNKMAPDGNEGEFHILFKNGIFRERELIAHCLNFGILQFGGRGGKQVLLPQLDRKTGAYLLDTDGQVVTIAMKQFDAARRLILDRVLYNKLHTQLQTIFTPGEHIVDLFTDEISDTERA